MGREIRRVPPNWEHPKKDYPNHQAMRMEQGYQPLYDQSYREAADEWLKGLMAWEAGEDEDREKYDTRYFWDWEGMPPDKDYYRPEWKPEEMTWFQVYETVSEGTPVTPPFATQKELVDYLVANGDFWDQRRGDGGWNRENAEAFVGMGYAPSLIVNTATGEIKSPRDGQLAART